MKRVLTLLLGIFLLGTGGASIVSAGPEQSLENVVIQVLENRPDLVFKALESNPKAALEIVEKGIQMRKDERAEADFRDKLKDPLQPKIDTLRLAKGKVDAAVQIVAYSDFLCGYCAKGSSRIKELMKAFPEKIYYTTRHAPRSEKSHMAARMFEAIALQNKNKAWEFYDVAMANQERLSRSSNPMSILLDFAKTVGGLDLARMEKDMQSSAIVKRVQDDIAEYNGFGFRAVPVYLYNGVAVKGAQSVAFLKKIMGILLDKTGSSAVSTNEFTAAEMGVCMEDCEGTPQEK